MNIYQVTRTDEVGYDENAGHVIAAADEHDARTIAAKNDRDEDGSVWFTSATVILIGEAAPFVPEGIILTDFNAG